VPTVAELGYPAFNASQWYGLCAPAATPRPVVERLNKALNAVLANAEVKSRLTDAAADVEPMSPEQFAEFIRNEIAKWTRLVKAANLKLD
jgi:tripartite-type tricarboxylate transporter receptor subunit TctC